jgi:hypothetical protein
MLRRFEMFRGVFVLRAITASNVSAAQTQTQLDPAVAALQTFFAAVWRTRRAIVRSREMLAGRCLSGHRACLPRFRLDAHRLHHVAPTNLVERFEAVGHLPEYGVLSVEKARIVEANVELRTG